MLEFLFAISKLIHEHYLRQSYDFACKAFDKMNHYALFIKLMNRSIPIQALSVLENWFSLCLSCVKRGSVMSYFYELQTGVRQGGVLSPFLFSIFIDDLVMYHGLRGSASPVLTATGFVNGRWQFSTPHRINTP